MKPKDDAYLKAIHKAYKSCCEFVVIVKAEQPGPDLRIDSMLIPFERIWSAKLLNALHIWR